MENKKAPVKSKTIWVALLNAALVAYLPYVQDLVKNNPSLYACTISFLIIFLRAITSEKIFESKNSSSQLLSSVKDLVKRTKGKQ